MELASSTMVESPPVKGEGQNDAIDEAAAVDKSEVVAAEEASQGRPPPKKRRRIVISCTECHRRKQKCDRNYPCTNCTSRNKQDACHYETGAPTARELEQKMASGSGSQSGLSEVKVEMEDSIPTKMVNFGYANTGASTMGFLRTIDNATPSAAGEEPLTDINGADLSRHPGTGRETGAGRSDNYGTRERYKSLIRQLPARTYIERLVDIFFKEVNFQYYPLEKRAFMKQLAEWHALPFSLLTTVGPQGLSPDMRAFPALVFQVLAVGLLVIPADTEATFESLKYAGKMTFEDLAMDYSESSMSILSLLGKRQMSLATVQAGFLRAAFLKYTALVTESWHAIGAAIRDAQEIGLHRAALDPRPQSEDAEAVLENEWVIQDRRRMWHILVIWDLHTGIVLGRPISIDGESQPPFPVDCPIPRDRSRTPVLPRGPDDPPTPMTKGIWAFRWLGRLREVLKLEKEGPCPKNFDQVVRIHEEMARIARGILPHFRMENPDTRFDDAPDCDWIAAMRPVVRQLICFGFIVLHRPYIFTRAKSRTEALKACLGMLQAQKVQFEMMRPDQYKTFSIFFGTFDAIVLMATIYICFPKEHPDLLESALQHFHWSVERFEAMSGHNKLAKAAVGVLQAIYIRLKKSLALGFVSALPPMADKTGDLPEAPPTLATSEEPSSSGMSETVATARSSISSGPTPFLQTVVGDQGTSNGGGGHLGAPHHQGPPSSIGSISSASMHGLTPATSATSGSDVYPSMPTPGPGIDWSLPSDFDWASIQPIYAMGDLVYNDLMIGDDVSLGGAGGGGSEMQGQGQQQQQQQQVWSAPVTATTIAAPDVGSAPSASGFTWQFEGDFGNDSVWSLLNLYTPF